MKSQGIILAGITGTTAFTLFSYVLSKAMDKNFKEPELIGKMTDRLTEGMDKKEAMFTGWLSHYLIGIGFAAAYKMIINTSGMKASVKNGFITGTISGIPAAITWDTAFQMHPNPPKKRDYGYYLQLIAGHAIFGAACFYVLYRFNKEKPAGI